MDEEYPLCPECGYALSLKMEIDSNTKEIMIDMFCEGPGEDEYHLQIKTGLSQYDIEDFNIVGGTFAAKIILVQRKPDPHPEV